MMLTYRTSDKDKSFLSQWWKTIDRSMIIGFLLLSFIGLMLIASAGPSVARRIGITDNFLRAEWWFFTKYAVFAMISLGVMVVVSMMPLKNARRLGVILFICALGLLALTPLFGTEIKGAKRWILGIQPSEFVKPGLVMFSAWMMARAKEKHSFINMSVSLVALSLTVMILLIQPDLGQTILVIAVWISMFFATGANLLWFIGFGGLGFLGIMGAYYNFSHVHNRINAFLSPDDFDKYGVNYQSEVARKAFSTGGFFGRGPGEGEVKNALPDAHTDYIFAVAGEEFGLILCLFVVALYGFLIMRCLMRVSKVHDHFSRIGAVGLISLFGLQAFINMAVNLGLFPPKGMTLPFISYGGSSVIALGFLTGFVLCLSRKRPAGYSL